MIKEKLCSTCVCMSAGSLFLLCERIKCTGSKDMWVSSSPPLCLLLLSLVDDDDKDDSLRLSGIINLFGFFKISLVNFCQFFNWLPLNFFGTA
jgi:hypothetical protein